MAQPGGVDVFIPCYNYGRFLEAAVDSALAQPGPSVRILIIDDASTDETPRVGAALAARHREVAFRRHELNAGHISTYNEGLDWAEREYFQFLSADDLLAPGALTRGVAFLDARPDVGLVYGRTPTFTGTGPADMQPETAFGSRFIDGLEFLRTTAARGGNPIANPAGVLVRTSVQHEIGGYRHDLPHSGDMEMWLRFAVHSGIGYLDVDQGLYRRHGNNMSLGYQDVADLKQILMAFESLCENYAHRIPDHRQVAQSARRSVALKAFWAASTALAQGAGRSADDLLEFARTVDPSIVRTWEWRRLRVKKLMGARFVRYAESLWDAARGTTRT